MVKQIILDTETTGLDVKTGHRIIEIGCVELSNRKFTGKEFQSYLNPDRSVDEGAEKVHGLNNEFLGDKPRFNEIVEDFLSFIDGSELLIHNAEFDIGFLNQELQLIRGGEVSIFDYVDSVTDTLQLARQKHPGQRNSLDALVQRYNITGYDRGYHGALLDSKILGDVYLAITGGQSNIKFETEMDNVNEVNDNKNFKNLKDGERPKLITLSNKQEELHAAYLTNMKRDSKVDNY
tara:strand:+ start:240 stop:944 length:705 start_codon:yes stop_codon:yes gene_type:complete